MGPSAGAVMAGLCKDPKMFSDVQGLFNAFTMDYPCFVHCMNDFSIVK